MIFVIYSDFPFKAHGYILLAAKRLAEANPSRQTGMKLHTESHGGGRRGFCCSWKCPHFLSNSRWFSNGGSPPIGSHLLFKIWSLSSVQLHVVFLASQMNMFCMLAFVNRFSSIIFKNIAIWDGNGGLSRVDDGATLRTNSIACLLYVRENFSLLKLCDLWHVHIY